MFGLVSIRMSGTLSRGMCSPVRTLRNLQHPAKREISTSIVKQGSIQLHNSNEFMAKVMNSSRPVIINFHAEWCEPCKILTPRLRALIEPLEHLDLAVLEAEAHIDLLREFEVKAVPAVVAIRDGVVVDKFIGLVDADMIEHLISKLSHPPYDSGSGNWFQKKGS